MKCPNCQSENSDTAKFCKKCGTALNGEPAGPNSHDSMVQSMNEQKTKDNNTKIIIIALAIVAIVLAGAFVYMYATGNSSSNHSDSASNNATPASAPEKTETTASQPVQASTPSMKIKGGSFSTGSADADKTYAAINVGTEHSGESGIVQIYYSRNGNALNHGNMVPAHVHSDGYFYITSADAYKYYPDHATINLYDSNSNLMDTRSVSLHPTSGTQYF